MEIKALALNQFLSDIKLVHSSNEKQKEYLAHKFVLATQSQVFLKILEEHKQVEKIVLAKSIKSAKNQDLLRVQSEEDHLGQILKLVYLSIQNPQQVRDEVVKIVNKNNCFNYYSICQSLGLDKIKIYFGEYIVSNIQKEDDSVNLLLDSIQFQSEEMKQSALDVIVPKFSDFLRSSFLMNELMNLPYEAFKALVQRDDICVNEESDVFNLVYKYILKRESDPEHPSVLKQAQDAKQKAEDLIGEKPNPEEAPQNIEEAPKQEGEEAPKNEGEEAPKQEGEEAQKVEQQENNENKEQPPVQVVSGLDEKVYIMPDNLESQAKERLQNFKLTQEQKKDLLLSIRLGYVSHETLLKYSNMEVFQEFKDIFLQAISSKLNFYDSQEFLNKYQFNLDPRASYQDRVNNLSVAYPNNTSKLNQNSVNHQRTSSINQQFPNHDKNILLNDTIKSENVQATNRAKHSPQQVNNNILQESSRVGAANPYSLIDPKLQLQHPNNNLLSHNNISINPFQGNSALNLPSYNNFQQYQNHQQLPIHQSLYQPSGQLGNNMRPPQHLNQSQQPYPTIQSQFYNNGQENHQNLNITNSSNLKSPTRLPPRQSHGNIEFVYKSDLDDNGVLYYLGTYGKTKPYVNPHVLGQVQAFASTIRAGKIEYFVGREIQNFSTCNEKMSFMGVDLGEDRFIYPTAYTIRNRNSTTYVMLNWVLEASADGSHYIPIDKRIHYDPNDSHFNYTTEREREALKERGASSSYSIDEVSLKRILSDHQLKGFRFFRIVQISKNSHGSDNLSLSGFELYGISYGNSWF
ncbi:E3 ubiquitin-protein ligase HECTD1 (macronuclear) [Tetrahymena thermophila SB210]|uniref:E3 ubiquitin-protein ligase HECTD1 n=1 Tax=Tetrahymena thermophila (strain SB210) TaxID=312017 RepID=I7M0C1_TETTS|nr:E3 ubiquitin-protein ligase HECTD1 [Tetrahymena thermophila SB210]EAR87291.2 E3 ubiquitin-protein ligase HECTD1 [Tetrahymena thermophila SB210]|eukprot:XP_001007536.2 E3 ubiquitin-protein ligase HECTD1 [Tetrahymena thermophila SB210]